MVKVCGITEERDAQEAVHLGVDALGFDFRPGSPRLRGARSRAPHRLAPSGVRHDGRRVRGPAADPRSGNRTARRRSASSSSTARKAPGLCAGAAPYRWMKAFRVGRRVRRRRSFALRRDDLPARRASGDAEAPRPAVRVAQGPALGMHGRIVIAGNLEPAHIGLAIEDARPYGVDLLAEVEVAPGKKDLDRLEL